MSAWSTTVKQKHALFFIRKRANFHTRISIGLVSVWSMVWSISVRWHDATLHTLLSNVTPHFPCNINQPLSCTLLTRYISFLAMICMHVVLAITFLLKYTIHPLKTACLTLDRYPLLWCNRGLRCPARHHWVHEISRAPMFSAFQSLAKNLREVAWCCQQRMIHWDMVVLPLCW